MIQSPCDGCEDPLALNKADNTTQSIKHKHRIFSKTSLANKLDVSVATQQGSLAVDAVLNKLTATTTINSSPFTMVLRNINNKPMLMCRLVGSACLELEDLNFVDTPEGFSVSHPAVSYGDNFPHNHSIEASINNHITTYNYSCVSAYTDNGSGPVKQAVCFLRVTSFR